MQTTLLAPIDDAIAAKHVLTHSFYQAWQRGELTAEALQDYATQYYVHVAAFPTYLSALHSHTECAETRRELLENLIDEERGAENHPELWLKFAEGMGASREAVLAAKPEPEATAMATTFRAICKNGSVAAGLAALYAYESQIPAVSETKIEGLRKFYGVSDDATLKYFAVHQEADVVHSATERALLQAHLTPVNQAEATAAAHASLDALWNLLSGVCHRHAIVCN
jgi:pyrroloquinoline-quinone synthase